MDAFEFHSMQYLGNIRYICIIPLDLCVFRCWPQFYLKTKITALVIFCSENCLWPLTVVLVNIFLSKVFMYLIFKVFFVFIFCLKLL